MSDKLTPEDIRRMLAQGKYYEQKYPPGKDSSLFSQLLLSAVVLLALYGLMCLCGP